MTKSDDDIPASTAIAYLEESLESGVVPDPRKMHIMMSGVLGEHTLIFMAQLWRLLGEAQVAEKGIVGTFMND